MKVLITKTSDLNFGEVQSCRNLKEIVDRLLSNSDLFNNWFPQLVISKLDDYEERDYGYCDYRIEIYDGWRE